MCAQAEGRGQEPLRFRVETLAARINRTILNVEFVKFYHRVVLGLQNTISPTKQAKHKGTQRIYGSGDIKYNGPLVLSLIAHYISRENGADYARYGAYDIFEAEHMARDQGRNVEVVACSDVLVLYLNLSTLNHTYFRILPSKMR